MTVDEIINSALSDGITLSISKVGKLKIEGGEQPIKKWLPAIRENKTAILAALSHQPGRTENTTQKTPHLLAGTVNVWRSSKSWENKTLDACIRSPMANGRKAGNACLKIWEKCIHHH